MQKTAYEMRISDWSSDVCSSDLRVETLPDIVDFARDSFGIFADGGDGVGHGIGGEGGFVDGGGDRGDGLRLGFHCRTDAVGRFLDLGEIGRASCRERVCPYV